MSTNQDKKMRLEEDRLPEEVDRVDPAIAPNTPRVTVPGYAPSGWLETKATPDDRANETAHLESAPERTSRSSLDGVALDQDVSVVQNAFTRTAESIQLEVCERLSADDCLDASDVLVSVSDGEVILEGQVVDRRSKQRAENIARSVDGVTQVYNRVEVTKGVLVELGDRILGQDEEGSGHSGSGTKNAPRAHPLARV